MMTPMIDITRSNKDSETMMLATQGLEKSVRTSKSAMLILGIAIFIMAIALLVNVNLARLGAVEGLTVAAL